MKKSAFICVITHLRQSQSNYSWDRVDLLSRHYCMTTIILFIFDVRTYSGGRKQPLLFFCILQQLQQKMGFPPTIMINNCSSIDSLIPLSSFTNNLCFRSVLSSCVTAGPSLLLRIMVNWSFSYYCLGVRVEELRLLQ